MELELGHLGGAGEGDPVGVGPGQGRASRGRGSEAATANPQMTQMAQMTTANGSENNKGQPRRRVVLPDWPCEERRNGSGAVSTRPCTTVQMMVKRFGGFLPPHAGVKERCRF